MTTIRVYEPALCCNTGVCGPETDDALVTFTADLAYLKEQGVDIERRNLANDPAAFAADEIVLAFLKTAGSAGLPLTVVDGVTVRTGTYPSRDDLIAFARVQAPVGATLLATSPQGNATEGGCCGGGGACC
jgi:hypothetical protein